MGGALLTTSLALLAGALVAAAALPRPNRVALSLALAPGLGLGGLSLVYFFASGALIRRPGFGLFVAAALLLAIGIRLVRRSKPSAAAHGSSRLLAVLAVAAATIAVYAFFAAVKETPDGGFDAIAIWNVRARFLFHLGGALRDQLPAMVQGHADYPLHLPGAIAAQLTTLNDLHAGVPVTTALAFLLGTPLLAFAALRLFAPSWAGIATALLILSTPLWIARAAAQDADVPLAYVALGAALGLASLLNPDPQRRIPAPIAGFFVGLLGWTKNEGLVLALIFGATFVVMAPWRRIGPVLLGAIPPLAAIAIFKRSWAPTNDLIYGGLFTGLFERASDPARWGPVVSGFARELVDVGRWGIVWPCLGVLALLFLRKRSALSSPPMRFLTIAVAACSAAWFAIYVVTPARQDWHIETSLFRLLLQLFPMIAAWMLLVLASSRPADP